MTKEIRTIIADDEPPSLELLKSILTEHPDIKVVAECSSGREVIQRAKRLRPEVLFLDIEMPDYNGFEALERLPKDLAPIVIFVTAYDQYAIKAFEINAIDYILKPFDHKRVRSTLERVRKYLKQPKSKQKEALAKLFEIADSREAFVSRIFVRRSGRIKIFKVKDIDWIEAHGDYVKIHVKDEMHLLHEKIGTMESKLNPRLFMRIHRSTIVNIERVKEMEPIFHQDYTVLMEDGKKLTMSRTFQDKVFKALSLAED